MTADEWVVISSKEYDQLQSRIKQYERFIQGQPAIAQELFELRQQVRDAEAAHAASPIDIRRTGGHEGQALRRRGRHG